jgi:nitrite reductase/ring-hydroxylating ferredoxin subunit/uncharacterized membrane protein
MDQFESEKVINKIPKFKEYALSVSRWIHDKILEGGRPVRLVADFFHGSWLGHPLHPVLTDFVIGAWVMGAILDFFAAMNGSRKTEQAADRLIGLGVAGAVPTAIAGLTDYTTVPRRAASTGALHGLLNTVGLGIMLVSLGARKKGRRGSGIFLSSMGIGLMTVSAWLGGELTFRYSVGVNRSSRPKGPSDWTPVIGADELLEQEPRRVEFEGTPILLYRYNGAVYAIGAVCGHDGGPLDEGRFEGYCVECPWHQSVYDLRDGRVVHGPTAYSKPSYDTRESGGMVEIKLRGAQQEG